jgi:hypothetical protein
MAGLINQTHTIFLVIMLKPPLFRGTAPANNAGLIIKIFLDQIPITESLTCASISKAN